MKVYISFDIEGVSGVVDSQDIERGTPAFEQVQHQATADVNAAVEGALAAGASEVVVYDGHGYVRRNLIYAEIHPSAKLIISRLTTPWFNMAGFDASYDAVFFVGWHARPSSPGILSHCYNSSVFTAWRVNGQPVGEAEFSAALAGYHEVPLVLFTGDDRSCQEVAAWCPGCECVPVKYALDRVSAICLSKADTHDLIREGATRALRRREGIAPFRFDEPVRVEADTLSDHQAATLALVPGVEQTSPLTVAFQMENYPEVFRTLQVLTILSLGTA